MGLIKKMVVICICAAVAGSFVAKKNKRVFVKAKKFFVVHQDSILSGQTQQHIEQFIQDSRQKSHKEFIQALVNLFPFIQNADVETDVQQVSHVTLQADVPVVGINNQFVVTNSGQVVAKNTYADHITQLLGNITMPGCNNCHSIAQQLGTAVCPINCELVLQYNVTWHSDQKIVLTNKQKPDFSIICNVRTLTQPVVFDTLSKLEEKLALENKKMPLTADVRFKDQIIISRQMGGNHG